VQGRNDPGECSGGFLGECRIGAESRNFRIPRARGDRRSWRGSARIGAPKRPLAFPPSPFPARRATRRQPRRLARYGWNQPALPQLKISVSATRTGPPSSILHLLFRFPFTRRTRWIRRDVPCCRHFGLKRCASSPSSSRSWGIETVTNSVLWESGFRIAAGAPGSPDRARSRSRRCTTTRIPRFSGAPVNSLRRNADGGL
jgi:hypothetical protein